LVSAAVSAGVQTASETFGSDVDADARRAAKSIAQKIEPFLVRQGWVE
jgi:hypothetical protein